MLALVPSEPTAAAELDDEAQFLVLINDLRLSLDLEPREVYPELVAPSRDWAVQLSVDGTLSHAPDLSVGVTTDWTILGENVGVASVGQTEQLFDAFVDSPGHYENLVNPEFRFVGVGVVYDASGQMWTTHRFMSANSSGATPSNAPNTTVPPTTTATPTTTSPTSVVPADELPPERLAYTDAGALAPGTIVAVIQELALSGV